MKFQGIAAAVLFAFATPALGDVVKVPLGAPPVALTFLNDSSVPVSNSRSAWFGVATSGIVVLAPCWFG